MSTITASSTPIHDSPRLTGQSSRRTPAQTKDPDAPLIGEKIVMSRDALRSGLISGGTTGGILTAVSIPLVPHFTVNVGAGIGGVIVGGIAGSIASQTADSRGEAILHGAAFGAAAGLAVSLGTGANPIADFTVILGTAALGALTGAIGGGVASFVKPKE